MPAKRTSVKYSCCPNPYVDITFTINIKRRVLYYLNNLIIPCVILAAMTALSFYLPPESGERVSLVITVLLGRSKDIDKNDLHDLPRPPKEKEQFTSDKVTQLLNKTSLV